jgi:hypothetical protein
VQPRRDLEPPIYMRVHDPRGDGGAESFDIGRA